MCLTWCENVHASSKSPVDSCWKSHGVHGALMVSFSLLGSPRHPEGGAGQHGTTQHAEGVGIAHLPKCHRLLDVPKDVHHPAGVDWLCGIRFPFEQTEP